MKRFKCRIQYWNKRQVNENDAEKNGWTSHCCIFISLESDNYSMDIWTTYFPLISLVSDHIWKMYKCVCIKLDHCIAYQHQMQFICSYYEWVLIHWKQKLIMDQGNELTICYVTMHNSQNGIIHTIYASSIWLSTLPHRFQTHLINHNNIMYVPYWKFIRHSDFNSLGSIK